MAYEIISGDKQTVEYKLNSKDSCGNVKVISMVVSGSIVTVLIST